MTAGILKGHGSMPGIIASIAGRMRSLLGWLGGREPIALLAMIVLAGATWCFIEVVDEVVEGETHAVDRAIVRAMRVPGDPTDPIGPAWVEELGRDATAMGGLGWLTFFTLAVAGYLLLDGKRRMTLFLLASVAMGTGLSFALKSVFGRPRPDIVPHLSHVATPSFPSGHSMLAAVVYLTLGSLLAAALPRRRLKAYVLAVAAAITGAVGLSRVYLGVHYPTDVLGGWIAGLMWALVCWLAAHYLQLHGRVEKERETSADLSHGP